MKSCISAKGQVTIPVEIRRKLGLAPGTPIAFEMRGSGAYLRKEKSRTDGAVAGVYGILKSPRRTTDEMIEEMRGKAPAFLRK